MLIIYLLYGIFTRASGKHFITTIPEFKRDQANKILIIISN